LLPVSLSDLAPPYPSILQYFWKLGLDPRFSGFYRSTIWTHCIFRYCIVTRLPQNCLLPYLMWISAWWCYRLKLMLDWFASLMHYWLLLVLDIFLPDCHYLLKISDNVRTAISTVSRSDLILFLIVYFLYIKVIYFSHRQFLIQRVIFLLFPHSVSALQSFLWLLLTNCGARLFFSLFRPCKQLIILLIIWIIIIL
jgi:hypothetical protein